MKLSLPGLCLLLPLITATVLSVSAAADPQAGNILLGELNCTRCHAASSRQAEWLTPKSAPLLKGLGSRLNADWIRHYLAAPHQVRPGTTMPELLHGLPAVEREAAAEALTHHLLSMSPTQPLRPSITDKVAVARGETLFHRIGCVACHAAHDAAPAASSMALPLPRMAEKWSFEGLRRFLIDPLVSRPSGRMPAMALTDGEATDIAHYFLRASPAPEAIAAATPSSFVLDAVKAAKGRELFAQLNCGACHEQKPPARPAPALATLNDSLGCCSEKPPASVPDFHLNPVQLADVRAALAALKNPGLAAPEPRQQLAHALATFRCTACHARDGSGGVSSESDIWFTSNGEDLGEEGRIPPRLDGVGDKLRGPWLSNVLARGASVRPYFNTRMPQFGINNVGRLPALFIALDRHPSTLLPVTDSPDAQRNAGRRLVGTDGLSCIACHRFNRQPGHTMQAIDLTTSMERLNEDWFHRFLRDPNRFNVGTRMPAFWPDGVSPLPALLEGSTERQLAALWTYLSDGPRSKFPEGLSRQNMELIVGGEAIVYRGKLWEAGFRAVAIGHPEQVNVAFDAEEMRLSLLWRGRFFNAGAHWGVQGMGQIRPLGSNVVVFPHGPALAVLPDENSSWPTNAPKELGAKFRGYQLGALNRPSLLYSFQGVEVEDFMTGTSANGINSIHRTIRFAGAAPERLYFRLAAGKLLAAGTNAWQFDNSLTLHVTSLSPAFVRSDGRQELLAPIRFREGRCQLEVDYVW